MIYESRKQFTLEMLRTLFSQNGDCIRITGHEPLESDFSVIGKCVTVRACLCHSHSLYFSISPSVSSFEECLEQARSYFSRDNFYQLDV